MRSLMLVGGGILIGVGLAYSEATIRAERKANERLEENMATQFRIQQMVLDSRLAEVPAETEEDLLLNRLEAIDGLNLPVNPDEPDTSNDAIKVGGEMTVETPMENPYWDAPKYEDQAVAYGAANNVAGLAIVYIEEDEFHEEDGREKSQILIHMNDADPLFLENGDLMEDWREAIGPNILVEFYRKLPPGQKDRVLYVRNNVTDIDYEVIQEIP